MNNAVFEFKERVDDSRHRSRSKSYNDSFAVSQRESEVRELSLSSPQRKP